MTIHTEDDIIVIALFTIHESLFILTATIYPPLPLIQYLLECTCLNTQVTEAAVAKGAMSTLAMTASCKQLV